jgi:hypothetical protein
MTLKTKFWRLRKTQYRCDSDERKLRTHNSYIVVLVRILVFSRRQMGDVGVLVYVQLQLPLSHRAKPMEIHRMYPEFVSRGTTAWRAIQTVYYIGTKARQTTAPQWTNYNLLPEHLLRYTRYRYYRWVQLHLYLVFCKMVRLWKFHTCTCTANISTLIELQYFLLLLYLFSVYYCILKPKQLYELWAMIAFSKISNPNSSWRRSGTCLLLVLVEIVQGLYINKKFCHLSHIHIWTATGKIHWYHVSPLCFIERSWLQFQTLRKNNKHIHLTIKLVLKWFNYSNIALSCESNTWL